MGGFELTLGPMYLGTVINVWLYGIIVIQATIYYASFPRDAKWIKVIVAWLLVLETLNSAFDIGLVWRYTIVLFGNLEGLLQSHWFLNIEPLMTVMVSSTVQGFFAWRIVKLTGRVWLGWSIASTILVQFCGGLAGTIGGFIVKDFARYSELKAPVIVWLVSSVVTDTVIASILIWYLYTHRTGNSKTDNIIAQLVRNTMQNGLMFTMWAIGNLILFMVMSHTTMYLLLQLPLCKLYTASLLSTLNARKGIRESANTEETSDTIMGWQANSMGDSRNRAKLQPIQRQSEGHKTNAQFGRPETVVQIVTTDSGRRDSSYEMRDYKSKRAEDSIDIEAHANTPNFSRATAPSPKAVSNGGALDSAPVHWENINDGQ